MARASREQNVCRVCRHKWFPRGNDLSRHCPECGGEQVILEGIIREEEADAAQRAAEADRLAAQRTKRRADLLQAVWHGVSATGSALVSVLRRVAGGAGLFAGWVRSADTNLESADGHDTKNTATALIKLVALVLVAFLVIVGLVAVLRRLI